VVGAQGELANVLVYLVPEKGAKVEVHTSYDAAKAAKVQLDNKACRFTPHVATLRVGQTLELKNSDPIGHNSKLDFLANTPQNPIIPGMSSVEIKASDITKTEKRASPVSCSIHPWMTGWVLIQDHPYMGVSDATGTVTIKNLPTGKWTFQVWQEKVGNVSDKNTTDSTGKAVAWTKGKAVIEIKAGANDLGTFKVKNS
jgi:plastocyanin